MTPNFPSPSAREESTLYSEHFEVVREDLPEEKYFSRDFRKFQCVLGKDVVNRRVLTRGEGLGCSQNCPKAGVAGEWSASGNLRLESRQEGPAGPLGQREAFRFFSSALQNHCSILKTGVMCPGIEFKGRAVCSVEDSLEGEE